MMHKMYQQKRRNADLEGNIEQVVNRIKELSAGIKQKKNQFQMHKKFKPPVAEKKGEQSKLKTIDRAMV